MVNIHGKNYAEVKDRVKDFHKDNKCGSIITEIITNEGGLCIFKATVWPDANEPLCLFTGHAYEKEGSSQINRTSYIENCETSAIGRALASAGYGVDASFSSANEVANAVEQQGNTIPKPTTRTPAKTSGGTLPACPKCGKKNSVIRGKEEYGGGFVCFKKKNDGCGHTWQADDVPLKKAETLPVDAPFTEEETQGAYSKVFIGLTNKASKIKNQTEYTEWVKDVKANMAGLSKSEIENLRLTRAGIAERKGYK